MNKFYRDILNISECNAIASQMMDFSIKGKTRIENDPRFSARNAEGFHSLPETLNVVSKLEMQIKKDYGSDIVFENSFTRIYRNGSSLECHVDRPNLDIALSVCVYSKEYTQWPLCVSKKFIDSTWNKKYTADYKTDYDQYYTPIGSGVACLGTKSPHWREVLKCNDTDLVIQSFFHWKKLN